MELLGIPVAQLVAKALTLGVAVALALVVQHFVVRFARAALDRTEIPSASIFVNVLRALVWSLALLSVMRPVFGVEPTAFLAALGVASVAVSLGMQDTISNLVSGLGLMAGKVVKPGDDVTVGAVTGRVTDVTWRSTTVRTRGGNVEVIPNSVLNKTSLTHVTRWNVGVCRVPLAVAPGADLDVVARDVREAATRALGESLDPEFETGVVFLGFSAYGTQGEAQLHVVDGVAFSAAQDALVRELQGRPWIARAL